MPPSATTTAFILHLLISSLLFLTTHPSSLSSSSPDDDSAVAGLFEAWCWEHNRTYTSPQQRLHRYRVFLDNLEFIWRHNSLENRSYSLGLNGFADLTHQEFRDSRLGLGGLLADGAWLSGDGGVGDSPVSGIKIELPSSVDWRNKGAVTPVKDQGNCGACWSFSATGAIEGINKIVTGSLVSLSEQELVDCDGDSNQGCNGGLMDYAFRFVVKNHGIDTENDYPYTGREAPCNKNKLKRHVVTIDGHSDVPANNEELLLKAVASQPVSVGICGSERAFQLYSKGIFDGPCSDALDHAVLIVGYGLEDGNDHSGFHGIMVRALPVHVQAVAKEWEVEAILTLILLNGGRLVERVVGTGRDNVARLVTKHAAAVASAESTHTRMYYPYVQQK
ncbi:hypothetical protein MLD38_024790 [Melastoma candidum]|uniref:Uncharacterized protein n=1 Tax=Melastoma candidum TaxID=119954 RepID=A0ACB9P073_9MYRT|nr:hypothetical protein MLD38_024790 [Melastoma candidum]